MKHNNLKKVALLASLFLLTGISAEQGNTAKKASNAVVKKVSDQDKQYAECLKESGITMYGASWCGHCKHQKAEFGELFSYVNYVDCEKQPKVCKQRNVTGYPTWLLPDGREIKQGSVKQIAQSVGCKLNANENAVKPAKDQPENLSQPQVQQEEYIPLMERIKLNEAKQQAETENSSEEN